MTINQFFQTILPYIIPIGILGYFIKAYLDLQLKRWEWKEKRYSDLIKFMGQFYYRPECLEDAGLRDEYFNRAKGGRCDDPKCTKNRKLCARSWLLNIMWSRADELYLIAGSEVIDKYNALKEVDDSDAESKVKAVGDLLFSMRKDLDTGSARLSRELFKPIYSEAPDPTKECK